MSDNTLSFCKQHCALCPVTPIHLIDILTLDKRHPEITEAFQAGIFDIHKTSRSFSGKAIAQAHQQANAVIKGDYGAVGITEDPSALRR